MNFYKTAERIVDDARIAMSYPAYESKALEAHRATAARQFSIAGLELKIQKLMAGPNQIADERFKQPIEKLKHKIAETQRKLNAKKEDLTLLSRDYGSELDALYKAKAQLFQKLGSVKEKLDSAYEDLEEASSDLDNWYGKSQRTFFGNGGRALPRHSFFGQSLGDRNSLKGDRDSAGGDIASCKAEKTEIKRSIDLVMGKINALKAERQRGFNLHRSGESRYRIESAMRSLTGLLADASQDCQNLQIGLSGFIDAARHRTGVVSIEAQIEKVSALRQSFLKAFDTEQAKQVRKASHRREWLIAHGRHVEQ